MNEAGKEAAAQAAVALIENGMTVGLGTGSTASRFIHALADRVRAESLQIRGVATSKAAEAHARRLGIPVFPLGRDTAPDITVDGADEVDSHLNLIKGGGGALVEEKLVAVSSKRMIVVADDGKNVGTLGKFPLPVAIVPFGWETTMDRLIARFGVPAELRPAKEGENGADSGDPFVTDDGLYVIDLRFGTIPDPASLHTELRGIVGVAEVGLFVGVASEVIFGASDGNVTHQKRMDE